ncbi:hypothetical protein SprV_0501969800 [Sparganum proliferum]
MEAIVKKATMEFLEQGHLLSDLQHGFRQNRPCLSSLLLSTEQWTRALDEDGRVDVIYTDFKKAFDNVPHKRLIYILSEIGIRGRLLTWITDFLTGRSQTVCIEASTSTPTPDLSGVPQGSVLGPLLFLVYINDCVDDLGCGAILFADDVKLWRPIRSDADRQLRGDLIQTHRIVRIREFALDFDEFFELAEADRLRGHPFKLQNAEHAGQSCSGCQILAVKANYLEEEITKMKTQLRGSPDQANATNMPTGRVSRSRTKAPSIIDTPAPITAALERIAKKRENYGQKENRKTEVKKKSHCKKAKENGRLLLGDASVEAETKTLTDALSLMANALCPNTFADSPKQSELDRPSTSGGIASLIRATESSPQSPLPSASSKVVNIIVKQTDGDGIQTDLLNCAAENSKLFYGYIRQCRRNKDPIPLLKTAEGEHLTEDRAKADHVSEFFWAVSSSETGFNPSALQHFEDTTIMETVQFTEGMILTELQRLKESKSPGPDEIPAKILKELAGELAKPLAMLFHTSFETGYLPSDWKSAWITPLYKGGSRVSANNHRPVSLTSICCKIMEKLTKQQVMQFLEQNHLLSNSQHGFRKSRSSVTNLLYCLEHWTRAADRGDMVHDIYVDFKKAFDSVPHHRLLYKLSRVGVRVNDCANELGCDVAMFADDIKIWSTIRSEVDEARLQTNLDHLEQWSKAWHLPFNVNKCNFLRVGGTSSPNRTVYRLTGKPLQVVDAQ